MAETEIIRARSWTDVHPQTLLRVAAYCRVSTDSDDQVASYKSQVDHYREKIRGTRGWLLVDVYADEGITGTSFEKRKEFKRMIDDCMAGKIDMVITKSLSRFSRNTEDTIKYVRLLRDRAIPIVFEEEHINTCSMDGELMLTVLGAIYQQEVQNTSNHVRQGLKMKMKRGEAVGRVKVYGYDYDKSTKTLTINPEEAEVVRFIFQRYVEGLGAHKICLELEEKGIKAPKIDYWTNAAIIRIIKNVKYRGDLLQGKIYVNDPIRRQAVINFGERDRYYVKNHHEAIIDEELFDKAQEILRNRREKYNLSQVTGKHREKKQSEVFCKKIYCAECGKAFVKRRRQRRSGGKPDLIKWQCGGRANHGSKCSNKREWHNSWIESAFVESFNLLCRTGYSSMDAFLDVMKTVIRKKERERKELGRYVKADVDKLQQQMDMLLNQNLAGDIEKALFNARYNALRKELIKAKSEAEKIASRLKNSNGLVDVIRKLQIELRQKGPLEQFDAKVFEEVVDRVVIGREENKEYITFIYRDGEENSFNIESFQKAVGLKRQLNMVSAHHKNKKDNMHLSKHKQNVGLLPRLDSRGGADCSHHTVKKTTEVELTTKAEQGNFDKNEGKVAAVDIENCSMHSVKGSLHNTLSTKNAMSEPLDITGQNDHVIEGAEDCSMRSVNRSAHRAMFDWNYGQHGGAPL
ncbi:recombinase family protein [Selenomonas ruminantium]|uniref:Site-specific DNA recombinase n=1 Tax=Selenomonas ruminantium TaxID=971 RepID=A0A1H3VN43_SELRU|nr:recombinase family protein [Selenomonas ruminantium]SDZ76206.1 Site-specific DNA recombinase [Selenomonas ruminantium]